MTKPIEKCSGDVSSLESKHLAHLAAAPRRTSVMLKHNSVAPLPEEGGSRQVSAATNLLDFLLQSEHCETSLKPR